jgi:4'-phosphopantetheinyl transferase
VIPLAADEVHVWSIGLGGPRQDPAVQLRAGEQERHGAREGEGRDLAAAHAGLREILGAYLGIAAAAVSFVEDGKPQLASGALEFNTSHSGTKAMVAVARVPVGVDIERIEPIPEDEFGALVEFVLSPSEAAELMTLPEGERVVAYYRVWTRKEAYVKATGEGISRRPLPEVVVGVTEPAVIAVAGIPGADLARWTILDVPTGDDFAASVVVRHPAPRLAVRTWPMP